MVQNTAQETGAHILCLGVQGKRIFLNLYSRVQVGLVMLRRFLIFNTSAAAIKMLLGQIRIKLSENGAVITTLLIQETCFLPLLGVMSD